MANSNFQKTSGAAPPPTGKSGKNAGEMKMKTVDWPGIPGKAGPNRSQGVEKLPQSAKSEGI